MITYLLLLLGIGGTEVVHFLDRHKTEVAGVVLAVAAWVAHRARRRVCHTGARVEGMPLLEPVAVRRPDLAPKPGTSTQAVPCDA